MTQKDESPADDPTGAPRELEATFGAASGDRPAADDPEAATMSDAERSQPHALSLDAPAEPDGPHAEPVDGRAVPLDASAEPDSPHTEPVHALAEPVTARRRRRVRPSTIRGSVVWMVVGFLTAILVPAFAMAAGTSAAAETVREAVDGAEPVTGGGHQLAGGSTYLIVGARGTTGQCTVTGPDGSSLDIQLEEVFQAGAGTNDISLGSFATGSDGEYRVNCEADGAALGLTASPALGTWSILGGPLVIAGLGLAAGAVVGVVGLFSWIRARRNRWDRDPD